MSTKIIEPNKKNLFIIEDNNLDFFLFEKLLKEKGYKTIRVTNAKNFLQKLSYYENHEEQYDKIQNIINEAKLLENNIPALWKDYFKNIEITTRWLIAILDKFRISFSIIYNNKYVLYNKIFQEITQFNHEEIEKMIPGDLVGFRYRRSFRGKIKNIFKDKIEQTRGRFSYQDKSNRINNVHYILNAHKIEGHLCIAAYYICDKFHELDDKETISYLYLIIQELNNILNKFIKINSSNNLPVNNSSNILSSLAENKCLEEYNLTEREIEVLNLISKGNTNREIAEKLFISKRTVESHRANIMEKTNAKNTAELIKFAISNRLIIE